MDDVKPKMDQSERAARDLLNRKVREGVMERRTANQLLKVGLPFVRAMLAQWRREGTSPEWITGEFHSRLTTARQQLDAATTPAAEVRAKTAIVAAEMYLAIWAGLQADLGQFTADRKAAREIENQP
jgi:hypothetical protein